MKIDSAIFTLECNFFCPVVSSRADETNVAIVLRAILPDLLLVNRETQFRFPTSCNCVSVY